MKFVFWYKDTVVYLFALWKDSVGMAPDFTWKPNEHTNLIKVIYPLLFMKICQQTLMGHVLLTYVIIIINNIISQSDEVLYIHTWTLSSMDEEH